MIDRVWRSVCGAGHWSALGALCAAAAIGCGAGDAHAAATGEAAGEATGEVRGAVLSGAGAAETHRDERRALRRTPVVDVFERSRAAVVNIAATEEVTVRSRSPFDAFFEDFFHQMPRQPQTRTYQRGSVGSGFVIHPDGYVVTNAHVVGRATELRVTFDGGKEFEATIVASDPARDLAVLKIREEEPLPTLSLGRSDDLIGINTAVRGDAQNIGFAIPVDQLRAVLPEGSAEEAGLRRGDVILALGRRYVQNMEDLGQILDHVPAGVTAPIRILRIEQGRKVQRTGPIVIR